MTALTFAVLALAIAVLGMSRRLRGVEHRRPWVGDLRPGMTIEGPGVNEVWTVTGVTLDMSRGSTPTMRVDMVAGAPPPPRPPTRPSPTGRA